MTEPYRVNPHWRCFFCDEVFTTRGLAAEHFGTEVGCDYPTAACQIKSHEGHLVTYIRKLEEELGVWNRESHQIQQAILTLEGEVADQVRPRRGKRLCARRRRHAEAGAMCRAGEASRMIRDLEAELERAWMIGPAPAP